MVRETLWHRLLWVLYTGLGLGCAGLGLVPPTEEDLADTRVRIDQALGLPQVRLGAPRSQFTSLTNARGKLTTNTNADLAGYESSEEVELASVRFGQVLYFDRHDQLRFIELHALNATRATCTAVRKALTKEFGPPQSQHILGFANYTWEGELARLTLEFSPAFDAPTASCRLQWEDETVGPADSVQYGPTAMREPTTSRQPGSVPTSAR